MRSLLFLSWFLVFLSFPSIFVPVPVIGQRVVRVKNCYFLQIHSFTDVQCTVLIVRLSTLCLWSLSSSCNSSSSLFVFLFLQNDHLSPAMAAIVRTEATMERWVMKAVSLQKMRPKIQSLKIKGLQFRSILTTSPVLHEDVAEGAVEHGVDQVGEAEVEDQQVRHRPHLVVAWGSSSGL